MLRNITIAAILMLLTGIQAHHRVTFSSHSACAVIESTVKMSCRFTTPDPSSVTKREWYRVQNHEKEPQVLDTDPKYSGRVSVSTVTSNCELTLSNVSVIDSGFYNFRFKTQRSDWISGSFGVHLTVTDLQVKVDPKTIRQKEVKLACSSTCPLSASRFCWYRNGQFKKCTNDSSIILDSTRPSNVGSYSCGVHEMSYRSPSLCVLGKECWGVTYTLNHVCTLKGSSINLFCSYKNPARHTVTKSVWFIKQQTDGEPVDVREDESYQGRVQYIQSSQNNCGLRITNLKETDTQTYRLRIYSEGLITQANPGSLCLSQVCG
ncbi:hypothetical protein HF521_014266 [Silurus meridionalis]|uniref:Ig-like domain-containing protein n=1 Tax=Silurus meridionalis TaxID=175797 RepID=A0A8T0A8I3_SILME|nr:hypothetical protein HF521_014266 [Silurus meridionalis]